MNVGEGIIRVDGKLKVTGKARYAAEFPVDGVVHAVMVMSTVAAGDIAGFDLDDANAAPGVLAIITPDNAPRLATKKSAPQSVVAPLLQDRKIRFNGQEVAVVVADTLERAERAAELVRVRYNKASSVALMADALDKAYVPKDFHNGQEPPDTEHGDLAAGLSGAAVTIDATYVTPIEHHNPMELHATIAKWDGDHLTVWVATQGITGSQETLAGFFGLKPEQVTVICPFVGGGFGCKGNTWPPTTLAAMAARKVGRPVKLVVTRKQMFTANGYRPMTMQRVRLGASADGKLVAVQHDGLSQMSMPELGEYSEPVAMAARMLYESPNIGTTHRVVPVNQSLPTYMRAPGESSGVFALESAMDELAVALKMDPIELRLRNYADEDPTEGKPFASKVLRECYRQGAEAFGWSRREADARSMRDGRMLVGLGMATATYPTNRMKAAARVRIMPDGTALVQSGTQDIGTGTYTIMTQVAADALGLPLDKVRAELGDSDFPKAPVSGGSMTAASVMPAVQAAARDALGKLFALAAKKGGAAWTQNDSDTVLILREGNVEGPAGLLRIADLLGGQKFVEGTAETKLADDAKKYSRHAFGAQFAEVHVDPDLGTVRVVRFVGAFDGGRILNAKTARSQLIGGIVFGMGMALFEETRVDGRTARITNSNIADYLMPVNADVTMVETIMVQSDDPITDPLGAKGIGELPMVGAAPAIANAVYHATGIRVRELPIRIDKLIDAPLPSQRAALQ